MLDEYEDVLTVEELMEILYIGKNTAYRLLNSGEIKSFKVGRRHKIAKKALVEYIACKGGIGLGEA